MVEDQVKSSAQGKSAVLLENQELRSQLETLKQKHADLKASADKVLRENDELCKKSAVLEQVSLTSLRFG
jgi:hypothetical protein